MDWLWFYIAFVVFYISVIVICYIRSNRDDDHPCDKCSRWSECNGVDWEDCSRE